MTMNKLQAQTVC